MKGMPKVTMREIYGCVTMRELQEGVESSGIYVMNEFNAAIFARFSFFFFLNSFFGPPF